MVSQRLKETTMQDARTTFHYIALTLNMDVAQMEKLLLDQTTRTVPLLVKVATMAAVLMESLKLKETTTKGAEDQLKTAVETLRMAAVLMGKLLQLVTTLKVVEVMEVCGRAAALVLMAAVLMV